MDPQSQNKSKGLVKLFRKVNGIWGDYGTNNQYIGGLIWNTGIGFGLLSSSSILIYHSISIIIGIIIIEPLLILVITNNNE